jgi:RNA polymerase sigma factor (sigma-70 family)
LTLEEEQELAKRIQDHNDQEALERLITCNLRLVMKIAHEFRFGRISLQDLISEGNIGLIKAAKRYKPGLGTKFSSYASWWIKSTIRKFLSEHRDAVRLPVNVFVKTRKVRRVREKYIQDFDKEPTIKELVKLTNYTTIFVERAVDFKHAVYSIDKPIKTTEDTDYHNFLHDDQYMFPDQVIAARELKLITKAAFKQLSDQDQYILNSRFELNGCEFKHLKQLGDEMGKCHESIRQMQVKALKNLKKLIKSEKIKVSA